MHISTTTIACVGTSVCPYILRLTSLAYGRKLRTDEENPQQRRGNQDAEEAPRTKKPATVRGRLRGHARLPVRHLQRPPQARAKDSRAVRPGEKGHDHHRVHSMRLLTSTRFSGYMSSDSAPTFPQADGSEREGFLSTDFSESGTVLPFHFCPTSLPRLYLDCLTLLRRPEDSGSYAGKRTRASRAAQGDRRAAWFAQEEKAYEGDGEPLWLC